MKAAKASINARAS